MTNQTTREERRRQNHDRALAAYTEHHEAALALIIRLESAIANHDIAPDPENMNWGTVGSAEKVRYDLQDISDFMFNEGEYAE